MSPRLLIATPFFGNSAASVNNTALLRGVGPSGFFTGFREILIDGHTVQSAISHGIEVPRENDITQSSVLARRAESRLEHADG